MRERLNEYEECTLVRNNDSCRMNCERWGIQDREVMMGERKEIARRREATMREIKE